MNLQSRNSFAASFLLLLLPLLLPGAAGACIWPYQEPAYWREFLTGPERDALLAGQVGIVDSYWDDPGLFIAWRHFEGLDIPKSSWRDFWTDGYDPSEEPAEGASPPAAPAEPQAEPLPGWDKAVQEATGEERSWVDRDMSGEVPDGQGGTTWVYFANCLEPAFEKAVATLRERIARWGKGSREATEWLRGQDKVFANCSAVGENPPELDDSWPAELRADRQYQIAAADFYAMRYEAAAARFRRIAADKTSPWASAAAFAVARCTLRRQLYAQAAGEFRAILAKPELAEFHPSAERLAQFAELRADPEAQANRLEAELHAKKLAPGAVDRLYDVRWLAKRLPASPERPLIYFLQSLSTEKIPATEVYANWKKSPSPAALVVTLRRTLDSWIGDDAAQHAEGVPRLGNAESEALIEAAAKVGKGSPAYLATRFYRASLLSTLGRDDEARQELDHLIAEKVGDRGDVQRLRHSRAHLARDWNELVAYGLLIPLGETDEEHSQIYDEIDLASYNKDLAEDQRVLIPVAMEAINRFASLAELEKLQKNATLPKHYRRELALVGFLRAALQNQVPQAEAFAAAAMAVEPPLQELFAEWRGEPDADRKKFAAALLALRQPGLSVDLWPTWGRSTPREEIDSMRENWWCAHDELPVDGIRPDFLRGKPAPDDATAGWASGPNHLGNEVLAYAKKQPDDPRLPEALHRTVKATRYACMSGEVAATSKAAFELLHKRFPKTDWAKQTPYWFE